MESAKLTDKIGKMEKEIKGNGSQGEEKEASGEALLAEEMAQELKKKEEEIASLKEELKKRDEQIQMLISELKKEVSSALNKKLFYEREVNTIKERANEELLEKLVGVQENFARALQALRDFPDSPLKKGVELIYKQLEDLLRKEGVEEIPSLGKPFDCNLHEAEGFVETDSCPDGVIIEELQKGYSLKGKTLRPARVRVARRKIEEQLEGQFEEEK